MRKLPWYVDLPPVRRWIKWMEDSGHGENVWWRVEQWEKMVEEHGVVKTSVDGFVGTIQLCYPPKANSYVPPMYKLLLNAIVKMQQDDDVRVIVLTGTGKTFSTGGHVGVDGFYAGLDAGDHGSTPEPMRQTFVEMFQPMTAALYNCEKPTIAMINGRVMNEATELVLAADFRTVVADADIRFTNNFTGNTTFHGGAWLLPRLIGLSQATRLLLTAAHIDGDEAHRLGLAALVAQDQESLAEQTYALANRIAALPPITSKLIKKEIHRGLEIANFDANLDIVSMIETIVQATEDHMDAENAVIEKRAPVVRGR